jgi:hypothetical protein
MSKIVAEMRLFLAPQVNHLPHDIPFNLEQLSFWYMRGFYVCKVHAVPVAAALFLALFFENTARTIAGGPLALLFFK